MRPSTAAYFVVGWVLSSSVQAEVLSLTTARDLAMEEGAVYVDGGVSLGDINLFGARVSYDLSDRVLVFGDLGFADWDDYDNEDGPAFGAGVLATWDVDLPFALGVKGSYHGFFADDIDLADLTGGFVASGPVGGEEKLSWYGEVGVHWLDTEFDRPGRNRDDDETEFGFGGGVLYRHSETAQVFVGLDHIDETFFSMGLRWRVD